MSSSFATGQLDRFTTFGNLLHYLRRHAGITQTDLALAVGYSDGQISRLEQNLRSPDLSTIEARFVPALGLQGEPKAIARLMEMAAKARDENAHLSRLKLPRYPKSIRSICVLPFMNISHDPENEYFCDGLSEDLINALTRIQQLFVVSRTSAFFFKGRNLDVREIGQKLNVDSIVEGSVNRVGDRLRITAQLINVEDGFHLWSERYDREMADVFAIQDEITLAIVAKLKLELLGKEEIILSEPHQADLEAYNLYLKGRYYWSQRPQGISKAIEYFEQALEKDPNYALALAGLADCYVTLGGWENGTVPSSEAMPKGNAAASRALELDSTLADAYSSLAYSTTHYDWNWPLAETRFRRAFELNPNYAIGHHWYSHYLTAMGRVEESLAESRRCLELDPLDLVINIHLAWHYQFARQYDEAVEQCWKTAELYPNSFWPSFFFALAYEQQGKLEEAALDLRKAVKMAGNVTFPTAALGHLYAVTGKKVQAQALVSDLLEQSRKRYVPAYDIAVIYTGLGQKDQAFEWLDKAYQERSGWLAYLKVEPRLDNLRSDSRFTDLLKRVGLVQ
jgi:adenylate cyclase